MKTISFRLLKEDKDVEEILESLEGKKKAEFIRSALKFYINHGDRLINLENKVEEIVSILKNGTISFSEEKQNVKDNVIAENNSILCQSIQSLLDL